MRKLFKTAVIYYKNVLIVNFIIDERYIIDTVNFISLKILT